MENNLIKTVIKDHIAVVTMDAPPVNAQSREFVEELISVFDELNETPGVRVVVLTGAGKCFCAGADIKSRAKVGQGAPGDTNRHLRRARGVGIPRLTRRGRRRRGSFPPRTLQRLKRRE